MSFPASPVLNQTVLLDDRLWKYNGSAWEAAKPEPHWLSVIGKPATFSPSSHKASHATGGADALTPADIGAAPATGIDPTAITGTAVITSDSRLSDARTPTSHTHGNLTNDGKVGTTSGLPLKTGTDGIVEAGAFGTSAGQFAEGNHTHADLHTRSHAITSTSDHTAGNHKVFYSDGSGNIQELALGATGTVLTSAGTSSAPSFTTASGGISAIGTTAADILSVSGSDLVADDAGADKLLFWDDSEGKLTHLELGTALSITGTTLNATTATYLASKTLARFTPRENQPPATAFATFDTRNSIAVLDFDAATDESAIFSGVIPDFADLSSGLKIRLAWMATTATSGNVRWGVQFERMTTDLDADSFDTATLTTSAANGTSGIVTIAEITATDIDGLAVGDTFRIKIYRDADDATNDTMTGDAELIAVEVQQVA